MSIKITLNKPAVDAMRAGIARLADVANKLDRTTDEVKAATAINAEVAKATARTYRLWSAVAWADLLRRFTGR